MSTAVSDPNILKLADAIAGWLSDQLKDQIQAKQPARIPVEIDLWDTETVATYMNVKPRQVTERYAIMPGFPQAIRLPTPTGGRGHPMWRAVEIIAWVGKYQERRVA